MITTHYIAKTKKNTLLMHHCNKDQNLPLQDSFILLNNFPYLDMFLAWIARILSQLPKKNIGGSLVSSTLILCL
jgi:hypothetical protein